MRLALLALLALLMGANMARAEEADSPHHMLKPDGSIDTDKCALCHESDMSLSRPKVETCTLCHAITVHSGAYEHVHASPVQVGQLIPPDKEGTPHLPRTDDGGLYCGTCHTFHDPSMEETKPLAQGWLPPSTGLSEAVRRALEERWISLANKYNAPVGATFATKPVKALRLPVNDGALCRHCHGDRQ